MRARWMLSPGGTETGPPIPPPGEFQSWASKLFFEPRRVSRYAAWSALLRLKSALPRGLRLLFSHTSRDSLRTCNGVYSPIFCFCRPNDWSSILPSVWKRSTIKNHSSLQRKWQTAAWSTSLSLLSLSFPSSLTHRPHPTRVICHYVSTGARRTDRPVLKIRNGRELLLDGSVQ